MANQSLFGARTKLWDERPYLRTRPHETSDQRSARVGVIWRAEKAREAEDNAVAAALRNEGPPSPHEPPPAALPDLAQVKGWSKADPAKRPHHPEVGVFGGWRIGDLSEEQRALAKRRREERRSARCSSFRPGDDHASDD